MNITIELDQEGIDVIAKRVDEMNANIATANEALPEGEDPQPDIDAEGYMTQTVEKMIAGWKVADYDAASARIREKLRELPYDERMAIVDDLESR